MEHPEVWYHLCEFLHQDFLIVYNGLEHGLSEFSNSLEIAQRNELVQHLKILVESEWTEEQLFDEWDKSGAQIGPAGSSMREMFSTLIEMMETKRP
jgi:hypothetical protein